MWNQRDSGRVLNIARITYIILESNRQQNQKHKHAPPHLSYSTYICVLVIFAFYSYVRTFQHGYVSIFCNLFTVYSISLFYILPLCERANMGERGSNVDLW